IRIELRELIQFIDRTEQKIIYTDFTDELGEISDTDVPIQQTGFSPYQYEKKVKKYIIDNQNHIAIAKLKRNQPLTEEDLNSLEKMLFNSQEIESKEQFEIVYGKNISLKLFIRKIVGLDRAAAKQAFAKYLEANNYTASQIAFINNIIDRLTQNGVIDPGLLYESPFTDFHYEGLDGVFNSNDADNIIDIIRTFNNTVGETFGAA
ncbi:MAG: type I restriction-modification enzyme R subunit C-terminal domain-containing protein, partial [Prochloraceae cyanobacterium]